MVLLHQVHANEKHHITLAQEVIGETLPDHITFAAATKHEFIDAVGAKDPDNAPKD